MKLYTIKKSPQSLKILYGDFFIDLSKNIGVLRQFKWGGIIIISRVL
jgi:hypothetical protein